MFGRNAAIAMATGILGIGLLGGAAFAAFAPAPTDTFALVPDLRLGKSHRLDIPGVVLASASVSTPAIPTSRSCRRSKNRSLALASGYRPAGSSTNAASA